MSAALCGFRKADAVSRFPKVHCCSKLLARMTLRAEIYSVAFVSKAASAHCDSRIASAPAAADAVTKYAGLIGLRCDSQDTISGVTPPKTAKARLKENETPLKRTDGGNARTMNNGVRTEALVPTPAILRANPETMAVPFHPGSDRGEMVPRDREKSIRKRPRYADP